MLSCLHKLRPFLLLLIASTSSSLHQSFKHLYHLHYLMDTFSVEFTYSGYFFKIYSPSSSCYGHHLFNLRHLTTSTCQIKQESITYCPQNRKVILNWNRQNVSKNVAMNRLVWSVCILMNTLMGLTDYINYSQSVLAQCYASHSDLYSYRPM